MFPSRRIAVLGGGDSFKDEYSLAFDGVNDVAYTQQHTIDIDGSDCTIGFWLKRDRLATDETIWGNSSGATQNYIMFNQNLHKFKMIYFFKLCYKDLCLKDQL